MTMIVAGVFIGLVLSQFVIRPYRVVGESMSETLHTGDRLIVNRLGKTVASMLGQDYIPKRGEIIVFNSPFDGELLVKRVIGLPGERVLVRGGKITVFNQKFPKGFNPDKDTDYQANLPVYTTGDIDIVVGDSQLFVSGDNRIQGGSTDSRTQLGLVDANLVIGDVVLRILPLSQAHFY